MNKITIMTRPLAMFATFMLAVAGAQQSPPPRQPRELRPPERTPDRGEPRREEPRSAAIDVPLIRLIPSDYSDGIAEPSGADRPNPRTISNVVMAEPGPIPNQRNASAYLWQWGQFLDHDIDLTQTTTDEVFPIAIPAGDPDFDPNNTGEAALHFVRSIYDPASGMDATNPRQQLNGITSVIDASNVYGSDPERARALRANDGSGRLLTSDGNLLPFNESGLANAGGPRPELFVAGDVRANEQVGLTALHTLFVREHNRLAEMIRQGDPTQTGDQIYRRARRIVQAEMQVITYREFLPILLGADVLKPYSGHRRGVDPSIANMFSTAAYRLGHSMLNQTLLRLGADGSTIPAGHLPLADSFFFDPARLRSEGGIEPILRGLAGQRARRIDPFLTDAVRNFLFGAPGQGGFDLASLNIQRGRDHGLTDYNSARQALGLNPKNSFASISSNPDIQRRLEEAYGSVERIDPWVGGLAEDPHRGALVGQFFFELLQDQFTRLRDGDRNWYRNTLEPALAAQIEQLTLGDIIRLNTRIDQEIPRNVFLAPVAAPF